LDDDRPESGFGMDTQELKNHEDPEKPGTALNFHRTTSKARTVCERGGAAQFDYSTWMDQVLSM